MKITIALAMLLTASAVYAQTPPPVSEPPVQKVLWPNRPDITLEQAEKDIQNNRFRFFSIGLVRMQHVNVARMLKKDYGIENETAAGCVVSSQLVARVRAYNERMDKALLKKYGKTYSELYNEVRKKLPPEQPTTPPKS